MTSLPETMKAVVFHGPKKVAVEDRPVPKVQHPKDIIVKVHATALCGSELHVFRGHQPSSTGFIMGHEFVGTIVQAGDEVSSLNVGDKVVAPFTTSCSECFYCKLGYSSRCEHSLLFGCEKLDGGQAEYVRVPHGEGTVTKAPAEISDRAVILMADIFPTGFFGAKNAFKGLDKQRPEDAVVVVVGCGPVGLCAIVSALEYKPKHLFAVDSVPSRLALAEKLGAEPLNFADGKEKMLQRVHEVTEGRGADAVIEVVGLSPALRTAYVLLRPFGFISSIGVHNAEVGLSPSAKNLRVQMGRCPVRSIFPEALPVLAKNQEKFSFMFDKIMPLKDAVEGYELFDTMKAQKHRPSIDRCAIPSQRNRSTVPARTGASKTLNPTSERGGRRQLPSRDSTKCDDRSFSCISGPSRPRSGSKASSLVQRLSQDFESSHTPEGFMAATGEIASTFIAQHAKRDAQTAPESRTQTSSPSPATELKTDTASDNTIVAPPPREKENSFVFNKHTEPFGNGYHFPPKYSKTESTKQGLASFWKFFTTPMGFFWTIYGLNVVAWGGMLFLLLLNAAPAMCHPSCDDIDSPRRKWVEWDSQILTVLFCVTAFGLAPWRFRDWYYLLKYRVKGNRDGLRRLAGIHRSWYRLPGTQDLPVDIGPDNIPDTLSRDLVPIPENSMPDAPRTGTRAPATAGWKLDFLIWSMVTNTFAQCGLCGVMWGMNRYDRPSWVTGFLVAIACLIAIFGGLVQFFEGKKVKSIEGVPLKERDHEKLAQDKELGIPHYNNIKDKKPKEKKVQDPEK
ncbi:hypothetical protein QBC35DRAFT_513986 [Podospora australis]|uniref:Uncharacterized protein n=1 Tax=Podospora australis TaxID=1536484 RepID=A0AAN6WXW7_9PEZI|nr:hypothetical protein QBC35DRAFT_513986 [Podospora australis]